MEEEEEEERKQEKKLPLMLRRPFPIFFKGKKEKEAEIMVIFLKESKTIHPDFPSKFGGRFDSIPAWLPAFSVFARHHRRT